MTHVDADHVEGVLKLLNDRTLGVQLGDIWFNGYRQLPKDELGPAQGEMLNAVIEERGWPGTPVSATGRSRSTRSSHSGGSSWREGCD